MCCATFALSVICIPVPVDQKRTERRLLLFVRMYWCLHYSASAWICSTMRAYYSHTQLPLPDLSAHISLPRIASVSLPLSHIIISPNMSLWIPVISLLHTVIHTMLILPCSKILMASQKLPQKLWNKFIACSFDVHGSNF